MSIWKPAFLRRLSLGLCAVALGLLSPAPAMAASQSPLSTAPKKPNVLLVLTDDIGLDQLQTYGYGGLTAPPTPNLQSIAQAGLTFRNAWTMPACSTARGVLYTGRYPFRTNLLAALGPADLANSMISPYENTLPKVMAKAGYTTALFGKFHIGLQGNNPYGLGMVNALGWNYFNGWLDQTGDPSSIDTTAGGVAPEGTYPQGYVPGSRNGGADSGACYAASGSCKVMSSDRLSKNPAGRACRDGGGIFVPKSACSKNGGANLAFSNLSAHYVSPLVINGKAVPVTDVRSRTFRNIEQTDAAIAWIKEQQQGRKPWFATVALATVHTPMQTPPVSTLPPDAPDSTGIDPSTPPGRILIANQMIQAMDSEMGRLFLSTGLATRKNGKLVLTASAANTIVIYVNDNGSLATQVRQPFDPQRSKGTPYQTGVWTPMIVAGPIVKTPGQETPAMVNIADLYELIGNIAGEDVRRNNPRRVDSVPMLPYFTNINKPSIRKFDFTLVGPNIQANGAMNGPCQFATSCSQIPVTKSVCEDNGGVWFGAQASGSYNGVPIPTDGFTYCCQVQVWVKDNGGTPVTVQPETGIGVRDDTGYKLVRNQMNDYDTGTNSCVQKTYNELYFVTEGKPPLLDREDLMIKTPYSQVQQQKFDQLTAYMNQVLASEPECTGDGNDDGIVNAEDLWNYDHMRKLTSGSSWYDINKDGQTNNADRMLILQNFGHICK